MSYDLMVFDPGAPPADREGFLKWYQAQTEWAEDHSYDNAGGTTENLRAWFLEMIQTFPAMNGPHATDDSDGSNVTDYSIGHRVVYAAFAWSKSEDAHTTVFELAKKHRVGFFDVSSDDGEVWIPAADREYVRVHGGTGQ